jgi:hypothetical protein
MPEPRDLQYLRLDPLMLEDLGNSPHRCSDQGWRAAIDARGSTTARWFDPWSDSFTTVSGSPFARTGTQTFTLNSNNSQGDPDWVLVLEAS